MRPYDRDVLKDLLWLINFGECQLAVNIWSEFRKDVMRACDDCPSISSRTDLTCGRCLELTLRHFETLAPGDVELERERLLAARHLTAHYH